MCMTGRGASRQKNSLFQDILITATGLIPVAVFSAFRTAPQFRILSPRHTGLWLNNVRSRAVSHTPLLVRDFCYCLPIGATRCVRLLRCILRCALSPVSRPPTTQCFPVLCSSSPCSAINHKKPGHFSTEHNGL